MLIDQLFPNDVITESAYGAAAGVETIKQLIHAVKDSKDIDLKVGPEMFPVRYDEARYLLSLWKANRDGGDKTADLFGNVNWIQDKLEDRDYRMGPGKLKDIDQERAKEIQKDRVLNLEYDSNNVGIGQYSDFEVMQAIKIAQDNEDNMTGAVEKIEAIKPGLSDHRAVKHELQKVNENCGKCPVTGEDECHCDDKEMNEAEFEITYKDPQFTGTRTHTIKSVNAKKAQEKFLSFGNPYKVLDVKKKEAVKEYKLKEDPTPKRRIMDFDNHSRYWSGTGEYQDAYGDLYDQLVPKQGKADTVEGELLRAVGKIIYRHGNDGDNFSNSSYEWIEKHVGKFDHLDDMADKVVLYVLNKKGDYTPNNFDWLTVADYGPGEYEKDWEQVGCNNCGGTGEIEYTNDDGEEDFEECDACDGNGWIEQTTESVETVTEDYKGWTYTKDVEEYEDNRKIFHSATKDGKEVSMDWSPYSTPTEKEFKLWVDLGMPTRKDVNSIGPLDNDDLMTLAKTKRGTAGLLQQEDKEEDAIDTKKLDAKTKIALKKAGLKYGAMTKGDPLASLVTFVADKDSEKTQDIDRLDQENDKEEADIAGQAQVDKKHDQAIGNNSLKDRYQDQEIDQLKKALEKILAR